MRQGDAGCPIPSVSVASGCSSVSALCALTWTHSAWRGEWCSSPPPSPPLPLRRRQLCVSECLTEYEDLPDPPQEGNPEGRPMSPTHRKCPAFTLLPDTCRWKKTYLKAKQLCFNWRWGAYRVLPLMRGHRKPVTSIACDGECGVCVATSVWGGVDCSTRGRVHQQ